MDVFASKGPGRKQWEWSGYPVPGCAEAEALAFAKKVLSDKSRLLRFHLVRMARNLLAYNDRFVRMDPKLLADTNGGYRFTDISFDGRFPEIDNRIAPGVDNTVSRLTRNEYEPSVIAERHIPEWEAAARKAKHVLVHDIERQHWPDLRDQLAFDLTVFGTACGRALWDETATDITVVASPDASQCPACKIKLGSSILDEKLARMGFPGQDGTLAPIRGENMRPAPAREGYGREVQFTHCPACGNGADPAPALQPYAPTPEEAEEATDPWKRPLGLPVPKGQGLFEVVNMFGLRPQNGGAGVEPNTCKVWGYKSVKELEWIATHHSDKASLLTKGDAQEIRRIDPILADPAFSSGGGDQEVYDHHQVYGEVYIEPMDIPGLEKGHRICVAGDKLMCSEEGVVEVNTPSGKRKKVTRATYAATRYNRIPNVFWGKTPVDRAIPLNRKLIKVQWMIDELQERGMPWWGVPKGSEIHHRDRAGGAYAFSEVELADGSWSNPKEWLVNPDLGAANALMATHDRILAAIENVLGPAPLESGVNQPSVKSGEHLQILADEAAQKRVPQERGLTGLHETLWSAHLEQTWAFQRHESEYQTPDPTGNRYECESYRGTDLLGQTTVKVESKGAVNRTLFDAKAAEKAVAMGLADISDAATREDLQELMRLPSLNKNESLQATNADEAWSNWLNHGEIPIIDATIHDTWIWYRKLGTRWMEDEAKEKQQASGWNETLAQLAGWERKLRSEEQRDAAARMVYEGHDPAAWAGIYQDGNTKALAVLGAPPFPPPPGQVQPDGTLIPGEFLPENRQDRVVIFMLAQLGETLPDETILAAMPLPMQKPFRDKEALLEMYACIQTCRLEAEDKQRAASVGVPEVASPGGGMTPAGTQPVQGAPVVPAPGGGAEAAGVAA